MSLVFAIKENDTVYFAADTQISAGLYKTYTNDLTGHKLVTYPSGIILGFAGRLYPAQTLAYNKEIFSLPLDEELTKKHLVKVIVPQIYKLFKEENLLEFNDNGTSLFQTSLLLAKGNKLFEVFPDGFVMEINKYSAIGNGCKYVFAMYGKKLPHENPLKLLKDGIVFAKKFNSSVGGKIVYANSKDLKFSQEVIS